MNAVASPKWSARAKTTGRRSICALEICSARMPPGFRRCPTRWYSQKPLKRTGATTARDYADVLAELVGRGEQHDGRAGGEPEPQQLLAWGRRCRRPHLDPRRAPPARGGAGGACQRESAVGP